MKRSMTQDEMIQELKKNAPDASEELIAAFTDLLIKNNARLKEEIFSNVTERVSRDIMSNLSRRGIRL